MRIMRFLSLSFLMIKITRYSKDRDSYVLDKKRMPISRILKSCWTLSNKKYYVSFCKIRDQFASKTCNKKGL